MQAVANNVFTWASDIRDDIVKTQYNHSIFCLFDEHAFNQSIEEVKDSNSFWVGAKAAALEFIPSRAVGFITEGILSAFFSEIPLRDLSYLADLSTFEIAVQYPIIEEVIFRLIFQNAIKAIQISIEYVGKKVLSESWVESRVFKIIISVQARIIVTNTLFALVHFNPADPLSMVTVIIIFIFPIESICYEKKGFTAACAAHMTHNFLCTFL